MVEDVKGECISQSRCHDYLGKSSEEHATALARGITFLAALQWQCRAANVSCDGKAMALWPRELQSEFPNHSA